MRAEGKSRSAAFGVFAERRFEALKFENHFQFESNKM